MSHETDVVTHHGEGQTSFSEEFSLYCNAELERRLNSGEDLDADAYQEAMEMVLIKLKAQEAGMEANTEVDTKADVDVDVEADMGTDADAEEVA